MAINVRRRQQETDKYQKAYNLYVNQHTIFDLQLFEKYMKLGENSNTRISIVENIGKGLKALSLSEIQKALKIPVDSKKNEEFNNLWSGFLADIDKADPKITASIKTLNDLGRALDFIAQDLEAISQFLKGVGKGDRNVGEAARGIEKRFDSIFTAFENAQTSFSYKNSKGNLVTFNLYKADNTVNMVDIANYVKSNMYQIAALAKEEGLAYQLGKFARADAEKVYTVELVQECLYFGGDQSAPSIIPLRSGKFRDANGELAHEVASTGVGDIVLTKGDKNTYYGKFLSAIADKFGVAARFSVKNYLDFTTGRNKLQGISRKMEAVIAAAANGNLTLEWALKKACAFPGELLNANNQQKKINTGGAILRQFAFDTIFGSGQDFVSDFIVNDNFYSGPEIAQKLFNDINNNKSTRLIAGSFSNKPEIVLSSKFKDTKTVGTFLKWAHLEDSLADDLEKINLVTHWWLDTNWFTTKQ